MKINLKSYSDMGKYCFLTGMDEYDTDRHHIYVQVADRDLVSGFVEVKIQSIDDLMLFAWTMPGISTNDRFYFSMAPVPWWEREIERMREVYSECRESAEKSLKRKNITENRRNALELALKEYDTANLDERLARRIAERDEIIRKIKEDNGVN